VAWVGTLFLETEPAPNPPWVRRTVCSLVHLFHTTRKSGEWSLGVMNIISENMAAFSI